MQEMAPHDMPGCNSTSAPYTPLDLLGGLNNIFLWLSCLCISYSCLSTLISLLDGSLQRRYVARDGDSCIGSIIPTSAWANGRFRAAKENGTMMDEQCLVAKKWGFIRHFQAFSSIVGFVLG
jgi:hypothetical protein